MTESFAVTVILVALGVCYVAWRGLAPAARSKLARVVQPSHAASSDDLQRVVTFASTGSAAHVLHEIRHRAGVPEGAPAAMAGVLHLASAEPGRLIFRIATSPAAGAEAVVWVAPQGTGSAGTFQLTSWHGPVGTGGGDTIRQLTRLRDLVLEVAQQPHGSLSS